MNKTYPSLLLLTATLFLNGCSSEEAIVVEKKQIRPVKLLEITDMRSSSIRTFPAKASATQQADLAFRIPGQLVIFDLVEGQRIKEGDTLARLDNRDANNTLLNTEASYDLAAADFKRKGELLRKRLISEAEYDTAEAQLKSAKASLANARDQLSYTEIKAPFSGVVAKISTENFQMLQANQSVLILQKDSFVDVAIQIPESLAARGEKLSQEANPTVRFSSFPDTAYPVKLKEFASQVTPGMQSYEVVFTLPQPKNHHILPGMSAELTLDTGSSQTTAKSAVIPASAIAKRDNDGKNVIWLFNAGSRSVMQQVVTLGKISTNGVEIIDGIKAGDQVVVAGIEYLSQGQEVKPLRWQRGV